PDLCIAIISSQAQKDLGSFTLWLASIALGESALKRMPDGSIRPFCEPLIVTSTPHPSCWYLAQARPEMLSTINSAGCPAASMALRTAMMLLVTPVEVSLCTTHTALMACPASAFSRSSIMSACTPRRQPGAAGSLSSLPLYDRNSGLRPSRSAILFHREAKWPVSYISTWSPGLSTFASAASQAPVPDAG